MSVGQGGKEGRRNPSIPRSAEAERDASALRIIEREREREGRRERCYGNFLLRNISTNGTTDRERSSGVQCTERFSSNEVDNRGVQQVQKKPEFILQDSNYEFGAVCQCTTDI